MAKLSHHNLRRHLATIFEDEGPRSRVTWLFDAALAVLIVVNVCCAILESMESIRENLGFAFDLLEHVATAIFATEYVLRVWACVDLREPSYRDAVWGRLRYMRSFFALIDLVSVLPAIIGFFGAADLRVLRLLRLLLRGGHGRERRCPAPGRRIPSRVILTFSSSSVEVECEQERRGERDSASQA